MKVKVLRLTRHEAGPEQLEALRRAFGEVEVVQVSRSVGGAAEVKALVEEHGADVLEAVLLLLLPLLATVCGPQGVGVPVIRAVMDREVLPNGSAVFRFRGYERVKRVVVESEPLEPRV